MLFSFTEITMKHKITEKCKISLQNVIKIYFLHIEKHNLSHIEIVIKNGSEKDVLNPSQKLTFKVTMRAVDLQF